MSTDFVFKELEPPPGGAERFARRLDELAAERPAPSARGWALAAAAAAVAVLSAAVVLRSGNDAPEITVAEELPPVEIFGAPEFDRLLGRPSQPAELTVVVNAQSATVTELESANAKVRLYQID